MVLRSRVVMGSCLLSIAAVLVSCGDSGTVEESRFSVRDSAGIQILENSKSAVMEAVALELVEDLRIGAIEGAPEEEFEMLSDLGVSDEGEIFALESRSRSVRVFGPEGVFSRDFGGVGGGPGEFQTAIAQIALNGDSVVLRGYFRFHVFKRDGEFLRSTDLRDHGTPAILGWAPQALLVSVVAFPPQGPSALRRTVIDTFRIVPVDLTDGSLGDPVLKAPSTPLRWSPDYEAAQGQWLGPRVEAAVRLNGEIYLVNGDDYKIDVYSSEGHLVRSVRALSDRIPVSQTDFEAALDGYRSSLGSEDVRELGHPDVRPISGRLLVAPSGRFLMKRLDLSSLPLPDTEFKETWDLFGPDGKISGRITTDGSLRLEVLTDEFLYAIARDEFDVEYIVRFRTADSGG